MQDSVVKNKHLVKELLKKGTVKFVEDGQLCIACTEGKQPRSSFCGPMKRASLTGTKCIVCFTCDFSKCVWFIFLKETMETWGIISKVLFNMKNQGQSIRQDV